MHYDVFICHASEDKEDFVRPLAELLSEQNISVWYDEFSLTVGDSLSRKIDEGLAHSRFGIVVISPNLFQKPWAKRELAGLTSREIVEDKTVILPIWHRVDVKDVLNFSPPLADKYAISTNKGVNAVTRELKKKIKPEESPLVVAREELAKTGNYYPPISDEWWLDIIEYKEVLKMPDINNNFSWIFPLPHPNDDRGRKRGLNIASAALQSDWSFDSDELNISSLTHPEIVHDFIKKWPGLEDACRKRPDMLALYAPQLTIPGFDKGFEKEFDELMGKPLKGVSRIYSYSSHNTVDGQPPLCEDIIALRHPKLGNYFKVDIAQWYFYAHDGIYIRANYRMIEGLVWLLSSKSDWLPPKYKEILLDGLKMNNNWLADPGHWTVDFALKLLQAEREFSLSISDKLELEEFLSPYIRSLELGDSPAIIADRLIEYGFISAVFENKRNGGIN